MYTTIYSYKDLFLDEKETKLAQEILDVVNGQAKSTVAQSGIDTSVTCPSTRFIAGGEAGKSSLKSDKAILALVCAHHAFLKGMSE